MYCEDTVYDSYLLGRVGGPKGGVELMEANFAGFTSKYKWKNERHYLLLRGILKTLILIKQMERNIAYILITKGNVNIVTCNKLNFLKSFAYTKGKAFKYVYHLLAFAWIKLVPYFTSSTETA